MRQKGRDEIPGTLALKKGLQGAFLVRVVRVGNWELLLIRGEGRSWFELAKDRIGE